MISKVNYLSKEQKQADTLYYRDRLTRFGFHYLGSMFKAYGVEIVVVDDKDKGKSVQEELVEDIMALIASFHAQNKLEEVIRFLKDYKDDSLSAKEILELIEKDDAKNDYF